MSAPILPPPAQALFALLCGETPPAAHLDWDAISVYALATGLGPLVLANAQATAQQLPPLFVARLRLAARHTETRNRALLDALTQILRACHSQDIPLLVLKGAYLSPAIYRDLSLRGMSDVDVLVRPADFPRLQHLLVDLGYAGKHTNPETGPGIVKHEWTYRPTENAGPVANPYLIASDSFHLEPHTSLTESWFGLRLDITPGVWDRAIPWELDGAPVLALSPADNLLHIAVHFVFHLLMGKPALVQLYDVRRLLETHPDLPFTGTTPVAEPGLLDRARAAGATAHLLAALRLAQAAYAAPVPYGWLDQLAAASPPRQRAQAETLDLDDLWRLTQQPPLTTLAQRLRRGIYDRRLAAAWAASPREALRVWQSALAFHRTDTVALLRASGRQRRPD